MVLLGTPIGIELVHVVAIEGTNVLDPEVVADSGGAEARAAFAGRQVVHVKIGIALIFYCR